MIEGAIMSFSVVGAFVVGFCVGHLIVEAWRKWYGQAQPRGEGS